MPTNYLFTIISNTLHNQVRTTVKVPTTFVEQLLSFLPSHAVAATYMACFIAHRASASCTTSASAPCGPCAKGRRHSPCSSPWYRSGKRHACRLVARNRRLDYVVCGGSNDMAYISLGNNNQQSTQALQQEEGIMEAGGLVCHSSKQLRWPADQLHALQETGLAGLLQVSSHASN
jgi:hypothetical protein